VQQFDNFADKNNTVCHLKCQKCRSSSRISILSIHRALWRLHLLAPTSAGSSFWRSPSTVNHGTRHPEASRWVGACLWRMFLHSFCLLASSKCSRWDSCQRCSQASPTVTVPPSWWIHSLSWRCGTAHCLAEMWPLQSQHRTIHESEAEVAFSTPSVIGPGALSLRECAVDQRHAQKWLPTPWLTTDVSLAARRSLCAAGPRLCDARVVGGRRECAGCSRRRIPPEKHTDNVRLYPH